MNIFKSFKTFDEILPDFLDDVRIQIKDKSFTGYTGNTSVFSQWLKEHNLSGTPLKKISPQDMANFFKYLATEKPNGRKDEKGNALCGLDRPTCTHYLRVIKRLYKFAMKRGEVNSMPFDLVTLPRKGEDMSAALIPLEQLKTLLQTMKRSDPQTYLAFMTEYYCFLRPGKELRLLKVRDVDLNNGTITVVTDNAKKGERGTVTMPLDLINIYKEQKIDQFPPDFYVLGNRYQPGLVPWSENMIRYHFNQFRDELGISKKCKLYTGKHQGASALHASGLPIREQMEQLRHTKLSSTECYLKRIGGSINTKIRESFPNPLI